MSYAILPVKSGEKEGGTSLDLYRAAPEVMVDDECGGRFIEVDPERLDRRIVDKAFNRELEILIAKPVGADKDLLVERPTHPLRGELVMDLCFGKGIDDGIIIFNL